MKVRVGLILPWWAAVLFAPVWLMAWTVFWLGYGPFWLIAKGLKAAVHHRPKPRLAPRALPPATIPPRPDRSN